MTDVTQVRINDLARELEVRAKTIIDLLPEYGVTEKKTHSSSIPADVAEKVRNKITEKADAEAAARAARSRPPTSPSVYISYAPEDGVLRDRIAAQLSDLGFDVWQDSQTNLIQRFLPTAEPSPESCRVFILLISHHYLASEEIYKNEFPHIRSLVQDGSRRVIYVILEQCPWEQRFHLGFQSVVIPGGGRTLSEGGKEQIEDDLHTLAREVRRAIQETDKAAAPPQPEDAHPTAQRVQPPAFANAQQYARDRVPTPVQSRPDLPPLGPSFAARLTAESRTGSYYGMSTLLSRSLAVSPLQAMLGPGILQDPNLKIRIQVGSRIEFGVPATIQAVDEERDFAVFQLRDQVPQDVRSDAIRVSKWPEDANWQSFFYRSGLHPDGVFVQGTTHGQVLVEGRRYWQLNSSQTFASSEISGAPVIVDDKLIGIVAFSDQKLGLCAISVADMVGSKKTNAVRLFLTSRDSSPHEPAAAAARSVAEEQATATVADTDLVPVSRIEEFSFSDTSEKVVDYAKQIALKRKPSPQPLSSSSLLFALVEIGRGSETTFLTPKFLYAWISDKDDSAYHNAYKAYLDEGGFTSLDRSDLMTENLLGILQRAAEIAEATSRSPQIHSRHLLGSLLVFKPNEPGLRARRRFSRMGFDALLLRKDFLRFVESVKGDDHEAWDRILSGKGAVSIPSEPPPSPPDLVPLPPAGTSSLERQSVLAGYQSDDPSGADLLGIGDEVRALASVLAAKDVDPPLSLGLFGDWGAGKSFFMHQLEARIRELQDDAKLASGESAYCRNIVQITFNAWNYIDCNLWASLTAEIFEHLASAIAQTRGEDSPEERALVLAAASSSREVLAEAEKKRAEAEWEMKQTEERLAALQKSETDLEANLDPAEILRQAFRFAMQDDQVQQQLDAAARALHIPEGAAAANEVRSEIIELRGTANAIILTLKNDRYLWVWAVILVLALAGGWLVLGLIPGSHLVILATRTVSLLIAISAFFRPLVNASRRAIVLVERAKASKQTLVDQKRKEQTEKLKTAREHIQKKVEAARRDVEEATAKAKTLNEQLEKMRADRRMADYIRQRHQSTDYTQHLGIISRVRADLRHLSTLLRAVKEESEQDAFEAGMKERQAEKDRERESKGKQPLFPRIDRIVLYIDDLDRCREENVVEVLQAVHRLLAFPLFVVVVGVDPRWLLHSLRQNSQAFQNDEIENGAGRLLEEERHWEATPLNYLEKIFQIPFSLRPIEKKGFGNIVDTFARSKERPGATSGEVPRPDRHEEPKASVVTVEPQTQAAPSLEPKSEESPFPGVPGASVSRGQTAVNVAGVPIQTPASQHPLGPSAVDRNPDQLQIRDWERAFMKELDEFIPTPRAGKRFLNIYRLLRASVRKNELEAFVGDEQEGGYQIATLLLAILTGYPSQATEILRVLIEEEPSEDWWEFVSSFKARMLGGSASKSKKKLKPASKSSMPTAPDAEGETPDESRTDGASWLELFERLDKVKNLVSDRPCRRFVEWAPRVARYSFQSGRVLCYQKRQVRVAEPK